MEATDGPKKSTAGKERWSSCAMDEDDGILFDVDDARDLSLELEEKERR